MNRNKCKQWFITYPQSGEETRDEFMKKLPPIDYIIICKEAHDDGSPHLHAALRLKHGLSKARLRKWIEAKWPLACQRIDYKPIRSFGHARDYCMKEDPKCVEYGTAEMKKRLDGATERYALDVEEAIAYCNRVKED